MLLCLVANVSNDDTNKFSFFIPSSSTADFLRLVDVDGLARESFGDDPIRKTLAFVTFETDEDLGHIDTKQVEIAESALRKSCNSAHPKEEIVMFDVNAKNAHRARIASASTSEGHLEGKWNYYYSWIFSSSSACNLCLGGRFGNEDYVAGKIGHLNEWEAEICNEIPYANNCKIVVAYEHEHADDGFSTFEIAADGYNQIPHDHVHSPLPALPAPVSTKVDELITTKALAAVTFKTREDLGPIDSKQISLAEHVLRNSCNKAHPEDEVFMTDDSVVFARVESISSSSSEEHVGQFINFYYTYIYESNIKCNLCLGGAMPGNDDEEDSTALFSADKKGHLKEWTEELCAEFGDAVFDCHVIVAYEDDVAAETVIVESGVMGAASTA